MDTTRRIPANAPIEDLGLSVRAYNQLKRSNKFLVADVASCTDVDLRELGIAEREIYEIRTRLRENGRALVGDSLVA